MISLAPDVALLMFVELPADNVDWVVVEEGRLLGGRELWRLMKEDLAGVGEDGRDREFSIDSLFSFSNCLNFSKGEILFCSLDVDVVKESSDLVALDGGVTRTTGVDDFVMSELILLVSSSSSILDFFSLSR